MRLWYPALFSEWGKIWSSQVPTLIFTNSPTSLTPVVDIFWVCQYDLQVSIACYSFYSIGFHNMSIFEAQLRSSLQISARVFRCLRLMPLLPPATQDSLHGEAGYPFHGRTFTRKINAAFEKKKLLHFFFSFQAHKKRLTTPGSWRYSEKVS